MPFLFIPLRNHLTGAVLLNNHVKSRGETYFYRDQGVISLSLKTTYQITEPFLHNTRKQFSCIKQLQLQ
jgi:hypothetical protein